MKYSKLLVGLLAIAPFFVACDDQFNPEDDNHSTEDRLLTDPYYAEGLLTYAYTLVPTYNYKFDEVGTDDAVSNVSSNGYRKIATGGWTAMNNPESVWDNSYKAIMNINKFLEIVDQVSWNSKDAVMAKAYVRRFTGESYALRAILKYYLLRNHGGEGTSGNMLGTPIWDHFITDIAEFSNPRNTFDECVQSINNDLDESLKYLPEAYGDVTVVPDGFSEFPLTQYNKVYGDEARQRLDARTVKAYKVRIALLAASPAFNKSNDAAKWTTAADAAGKILSENGGIAGLDPKGHLWFLKAQVADSELSSGDRKDTKEIIWRRTQQDNNTWEMNNYPPTQYGSGQINPTQNFVDAFPMKNGYPITDPASGYDPKKPYNNRDPRLATTVVYDKSKVRSAVINILTGTSDDALNKVAKSTRTGYYLRKLMREDAVNCQTGKTTTAKHLIIDSRFTEMYLAYAEAANEAWGPDGASTYGFSARDVIGAIRKRAGLAQPDKYLESITSKDDMRTLIRNERRLELCFESVRFWDLRRWKADLTEPAMGIKLENGVYKTFEVEKREYDAHMIYGPIPFNDVLKFNYEQNKGWE